MGPVGAAGIVMAGVLAIMAVLVGAFGGSIAWAVRAGLLWGGFFTAGVFLVVMVFAGSYSLQSVALFGLPILIFPFLVSWLTARYLELRARFRRMWATLLALACALILGFLCVLLGRLDLFAPLWVALAADVCLFAGILLWVVKAR